MLLKHFYLTFVGIIKTRNMRKFLRTFNLTLVFALGLIGVLRAQTTVLIDPAGAGGFELGNTFAANGWSVSNSANNPWIVAPLSYGLITGITVLIIFGEMLQFLQVNLKLD